MSRAGNWIRTRKRQAILQRDQHACVYCGSTDDLTLDHLVPTSRGGTHSERNLVAACLACNSSKKGLTLEEFVADPSARRRIRAQARRRLTRILSQLALDELVERAIRSRGLAPAPAHHLEEVPF